MKSIAISLADVLEADRNVARLERAGWPKDDEAMVTARMTLETMSEELVAAMDEHVTATIRRALAAMHELPTHEQGATL